ncbi:hypothetical protein V8F33_012129 [Rhypophila sp. PSN 637]
MGSSQDTEELNLQMSKEKKERTSCLTVFSGLSLYCPSKQSEVFRLFHKNGGAKNLRRLYSRFAEAQEKFRQGNPTSLDLGSNLSLSAEWWKPLSDLSIALNAGSIPKEVNEEVQAACEEFAAAKYSREAFDKFAIEVRGILAGHEKVLRLVEDSILKSPEVWEKMHEYLSSQQDPAKVDESGKWAAAPGRWLKRRMTSPFADASALKAAIYSNKTKMLCDAHGFGQSDVNCTFLESIMAHRESLQEVISAYGLTDPRSLDTRVRLAINLSDIGIALDDKEKISKAMREFEFAIKEYESRDQSAQALYEQFVLRSYGDGKYIELNRLDTRFKDLRKSLMANTVGPGKLALHGHMVEVLNKSGRCKSISTGHKVPKATLKALKKYKSLRKWSYPPDLHPDVLRAIWGLYKNDNVQAALVKMSYTMRLAVALSRDAEYAEESINICREVLEHARLLPWVGTAAHTLTASFLFDLLRGALEVNPAGGEYRAEHGIAPVISRPFATYTSSGCRHSGNAHRKGCGGR